MTNPRPATPTAAPGDSLFDGREGGGAASFLSLFSGCGGMDQGLERAGWRCIGQVECEPKRSSVARLHWPDVERWEDVRDFTGASEPALICGGFPCQDLSVAGRRAGLAGERSGLWWEFARILGELSPAWVLVENVPGLLSSHEGRDMALLLGSLAELGYGWAYRVLDAQFFGVAQRRRRVFIVGCLGDRTGRLPAKVLFDAASLSGDSPSRGEAGQDFARPLGAGSPTSRRDDLDGGAYPLAYAVSARDAKGPADAQAMPVVSHTLPGDQGFDAREDGTGRGTPLVAFTQNSRSEVRLIGGDGDLVGAVTDDRGERAQQQNFVLQARPRRLTPRECERLQGWPDDWTRYGITEDGERVELADGPRYRMIGDGVAASVAEWIGRRILECR